MEKISGELYKLMKIEIRKAQENGDFKTEIFFAERFGFYSYAGKIAQENGLFKRAYENFKKEKNIEHLENLNKIVFLEHSLTTKEIQINEEIYKEKNPLKLYQEKYDYGNWDKPWDKKVNDDLIQPFNLRGN